MNILNRKGLQRSNYFDDFFKNDGFAKDYRQILFHPGRVLQSREMIQLQTILNEYNKTHLDTVFKNGSIIQGCAVNTIQIDNVDYMSLSDGLIYFDGSIFKVSNVQIEINEDFKNVLETLTPINQKNITVGLLVNYEVITNTGVITGTDGAEQEALLDPAIKYFDSESTVGADRLKVSFGLVLKIEELTDQFRYFYEENGVVVNTVDFDLENNQYFDFARLHIRYGGVAWENNTTYTLDQNIIPTDSNGFIYTAMNAGTSGVVEPTWTLTIGSTVVDGTITWECSAVENYEYTLSNITYLNREYKFKDIENNITNIEDSIIEGLEIQSTNELDLNLNATNYQPSLFGKPGISNHLSYVNINKGIGKVNGLTLPSPRNEFFKFEKPSKLIDGSNSASKKEKIAFYKTTPNNEEGVFFKYYVENDQSAGIGLTPIKFDHQLNYKILDIGRRVAIEEYNQDNSQFEQVATANICNIGDELKEVNNTNNSDIWDKYRYQGFWKNGEDKLYIKGINEISGVKLYRDSTPNILNLTQPLAYNLFSHGTNGGLQAVGRKLDFNNVNFEFVQYINSQNGIDGARFFNVTQFKVTHSSFTEDIANEMSKFGGIVMINDVLYYTETGGDYDDPTKSFTLFLGKPVLAHLPYLYEGNMISGYNTFESVVLDDGNYNVQFIKYFIVDQIIDESTIRIEYNQYDDPSLSDDNNWDTIPSSSGSAIDFITITSPIEDIKGIQTILRNDTSNISSERDKFLTSQPYSPYMKDKYLMFFETEKTKSNSFLLGETLTYTQEDNIFTLTVGTVSSCGLAVGNSIFAADGTTGAVSKPYTIKRIIDNTHVEIEAINTYSNIVSCSDNGDVETGTYPLPPRHGYNVIFDPSILGSTLFGQITSIVVNGFVFPVYTYLSNDPLDPTSGNVGVSVWAGDISTPPTWDLKFHTTYGDDESVPRERYFIRDDEYQTNGYHFENDELFWKMRIADSSILDENSINYNNDNNFASASSLGEFKITYWGSQYKDIFLNDIIIESGKDTSDIKNGLNESQRIVFLDQSGNRDYNHVIEKGVQINYTPDIIDTISTIKNDFNDLSIPFVEDGLNGYSLNTLVNLESTISNFDPEGNTQWARFDFTENDKVLGIFQAYGNTNKDLDVMVKLQGTNLIKNRVIYHTINDNRNVEYYTNHQSDIVGQSGGNLGMNIKHFDDNDFVEEMTVQVASNGEGTRYGREFHVLDSDGKAASILNGVGMKYFFNLDLGVDFFNVLSDVENNMYVADVDSDRGNIIAVRDNSDSHVIHLRGAGISGRELNFSSTDVGKVFYFLSKNKEYTFCKIKEVLTATSIRVYEEVSAEYCDDVFLIGEEVYEGYVIDSVAIPSNVLSFPNSNITLQYHNSESFELSAHFRYYDEFTIADLEPLQGTVIVNEEISLEASDPIILSLYKTVTDTDGASIDIENIEHSGSYHPFMRIRENLTSEYGKPLPYSHNKLEFPTSHPELRDVRYNSLVEADYNYILPDVAHFYLKQDGVVDYLQTAPQQFNSIKPFIIQDRLYLGTTIIPPVLDNKAFLNTGNQLSNLNDDIVDYFEKRNIQKNISTNNNMLTLQEVYNNERRDIHFSTGDKFVYWSKLSGQVTPRTSKQKVVSHIPSEFASDNYYEWNKFVGKQSNFLADLNSGDVVGVYHQVGQSNADASRSNTSKIYHSPSETFIIKQVLSNHELILEGNMRNIEKEIIYNGDDRYIVLPLNFNTNSVVDTTSGSTDDCDLYVQLTDLYLKKEQTINFVQYLMNQRTYSVFNITNNNFDFENGYKILNLKTNNLYFNDFEFGSYEFKKPGLDIINNEILPDFKYHSKLIELNIGSDFEEYGKILGSGYYQDSNITIAPVDKFKLVDTKTYETGEVFISELLEVNNIDYRLNNYTSGGQDGFYVGDQIKSFRGNAILNFDSIDSNTFNTHWNYLDTNRAFNLRTSLNGGDVVDYNYYNTNKVTTESYTYKNLIKTITNPIDSSFDIFNYVKLTKEKNVEVLNGVSSVSGMNCVNLISVPCEVSEYDNTVSYLRGGSFKMLGDTYNKTTNGVYDLGITSTNIQIDSFNIIEGINNPIETKGYAILEKISTNVKSNDSFNEINRDFSYIFDQINDATYFERADINIDDIIGLDIQNVLDEYVSTDHLKFIKPNLYQTYQFNKSYMLDSIDFHINTPGVDGMKYKGNIAVFFGFLINGELTKNSIIHTKVIDIDANGLGFNIDVNGKVSIDLDTPIYIPKNKSFYIGFIKGATEIVDGEDCGFKTLKNGEYDTHNDTLVSFPAEFNSELSVNGVSEYNNILKIDFTVNKYEKDIVNYVESTNYEFTNGFSKFITFTDNVIPEETNIKYFYSTDGVTSTPKWTQFEINNENTFETSKSNITFKIEVNSNSEYVTPIFKNNITTNLKYLELGDNVKEVTFGDINIPPFDWSTLNDVDNITYIPVGLKIDNIENKTERYGLHFGEIWSQFVYPLFGDPYIHKTYNTKFSAYLNNTYQRVYRVVVDYINPYMQNTELFPDSDKLYGVPIILSDPNTGDHIDTHYDRGFLEEAIGGIVTANSNNDAPGMKWIVDTDGKYNTWTLDSNNGSSHKNGLGNVHGKKLIIKDLGNGNFRQIYEFVGAKNTQYDNLDIGLMLPCYYNTDSNDYLYSVIKNITISVDTLTKSKPDNFNLNSIYVEPETLT